MPDERSTTSADTLRVYEVSAGGLAVRSTADDLTTAWGVLIAKRDRRGRLVWSLPKGKVETGESLEETAAREVLEETGIRAQAVASLGEVEYWFMAEGKRIHKTVHHFAMRALGGEISTDDPEVTEVAWVPLAEIPDRLAYPDERDLVRTIPEVWPRLTP